jgi:hypothetical protein
MLMRGRIKGEWRRQMLFANLQSTRHTVDRSFMMEGWCCEIEWIQTESVTPAVHNTESMVTKEKCTLFLSQDTRCIFTVDARAKSPHARLHDGHVTKFLLQSWLDLVD